MPRMSRKLNWLTGLPNINQFARAQRRCLAILLVLADLERFSGFAEYQALSAALGKTDLSLEGVWFKVTRLPDTKEKPNSCD